MNSFSALAHVTQTETGNLQGLKSVNRFSMLSTAKKNKSLLIITDHINRFFGHQCL